MQKLDFFEMMAVFESMVGKNEVLPNGNEFRGVGWKEEAYEPHLKCLHMLCWLNHQQDRHFMTCW